MTRSKELTVFYDGACPLCDREIAFYRRRRGAEKLAWIDLSRCEADEVAPGLTKERALARFHVRTADGHLVSGGAAFAALWAALPGFRTLGRLFSAAPFVWLLNLAYPLFLRLRPRLQRLIPPRQEQHGDVLPAWLLRELRSNHAGETGAIAIYRGILALTRDDAIRAFAESHLETERRHLELIESVLPPQSRSLLLPLWRLAGFVTGAMPASLGPATVYATIDAVETFVDRHYAAQIERLSREGGQPALRDLLERCRLDEVGHRDEARQALRAPPGPAVRAWCRLVSAGSAAAVALARRI